MQYDLVFEGGGAKGMVFVGALKEFFKRGHTPGRLLGTSAGAITASLLAAGYNIEEIQSLLAEKVNGESVFKNFMSEPETFDKENLRHGALHTLLRETNLPFVPDVLENPLEDYLVESLANNHGSKHLVSFIELGGWFSADNFLTWLKNKLDSGTFEGNARKFSALTLEELYTITKKPLSLCATDTSAHLLLILNHKTAPQCPLAWAVRMSMSVPLLWQEVTWKREWGLYLGQDISGHSIVDGGVLSNFPIELFLSNDVQIEQIMGTKSSNPILGLLIDEDMSVPGASDALLPATNSFQIANLATVRRLNNLVNTMLEARDKSVISMHENLIVRLPAKGYGTTEFDMSDERRILLVAAGEIEMKKYFDKQALLSGVSFDIGLENIDAQDLANSVAHKILQIPPK